MVWVDVMRSSCLLLWAIVKRRGIEDAPEVALGPGLVAMILMVGVWLGS